MYCQNALAHIGADEKVLYAETPTLIEANLVTLVFAVMTTSIFVIEIGFVALDLARNHFNCF